MVNTDRKKAMLSIGDRPTLRDSSEKTEVHILDFVGDLYGTSIVVFVEKYLRAQDKYDTLDILKEQMLKDKFETLRYLE